MNATDPNPFTLPDKLGAAIAVGDLVVTPDGAKTRVVGFVPVDGAYGGFKLAVRVHHGERIIHPVHVVKVV